VITSFGKGHPLAGVARRECRSAHSVAPRLLLGGVACAGHWEQAIRVDARFAVEFGLPAEPPPVDRSAVDELAVDWAVSGHRVALTASELRSAVARLSSLGVSVSTIAGRLRVSSRTVHRLLADSARPVVAPPVCEVAA
jgi:hypothetical protein